ncbi:hypothetical protein TELCIR_07094 [Teladorsagia circumcincta]|uniref:Reverse transcriptase domain-containing protein n=1 Tax=Teladorsagia circumcincta TaxID=45464 RepID=A0A2G9UL73_TELCI|nr:hypothetical protein TELCIR_07094 [Teladorsagia circumcincta]
MEGFFNGRGTKERWLEHFRGILNQPNPPNPTASMTRSLKKTEKLVVNTVCRNREEVIAAIECFRNRKYPGMDEITAELLKAGGSAIEESLVKLFSRCWSRREVPEDWWRGVIVKLPEKEDLSDSGNWRGITLLSVPGKTFCSVLLQRLRTAIDERLREEQARFRGGRSCCEQIFTLRNIIEQCVKYCLPVVIDYVDFKKAFDSFQRSNRYGLCPATLHQHIQESVLHLVLCVSMDTGYTPFFQIATGVRQGCNLSPILFTICLDFVMKKTMEKVSTFSARATVKGGFIIENAVKA